VEVDIDLVYLLAFDVLGEVGELEFPGVSYVQEGH
jgi:hypothetical protein